MELPRQHSYNLWPFLCSFPVLNNKVKYHRITNFELFLSSHQVKLFMPDILKGPIIILTPRVFIVLVAFPVSSCSLLRSFCTCKLRHRVRCQHFPGASSNVRPKRKNIFPRRTEELCLSISSQLGK